jgi:hypothetical protein
LANCRIAWLRFNSAWFRGLAGCGLRPPLENALDALPVHPPTTCCAPAAMALTRTLCSPSSIDAPAVRDMMDDLQRARKRDEV